MSWRNDPLFVVNSKRQCLECGGGRRQRKKCQHCKGSGYQPIDLAGLWSPQPAFLVCGGPSLKTLPMEKLQDRGILSFGINNAGAFARTSAWCFSDPQTKFHHAGFFDPRILTFSPAPKLRKHVRVKCRDGSFRTSEMLVADCPGTYGFARRGEFCAERFFSDWFAHWGHGGKGDNPEARPFTRLCTPLLGLRLLHYLGCPRVYLLGVDLGGKEYGWGDATSGGGRMWGKINQLFRDLRQACDRMGFVVKNCNRESACDAFDFCSFDEALEDCRGFAPSGEPDMSGWYWKGLEKEERKRYPDLLPVSTMGAML